MDEERDEPAGGWGWATHALWVAQCASDVIPPAPRAGRPPRNSCCRLRPIIPSARACPWQASQMPGPHPGSTGGQRQCLSGCLLAWHLPAAGGRAPGPVPPSTVRGLLAGTSGRQPQAMAAARGSAGWAAAWPAATLPAGQCALLHVGAAHLRLLNGCASCRAAFTRSVSSQAAPTPTPPHPTPSPPWPGLPCPARCCKALASTGSLQASSQGLVTHGAA